MRTRIPHLALLFILVPLTAQAETGDPSYQPVEKRESAVLDVASLLLGDAEHRITPPTRGDATVFQRAAYGSITDTTVHWPSWDQFVRVLTLRDHNARVVVLGTTLLGLTSGMIGTFMLLRKRALMGDALSHATLPGIGIAFIVMTA